MMRRLHSSLGIGALLLAAGCANAPQLEGLDLVVRELGDTTAALLSTLSDELRERACCTLDDEEVLRWHFVPGRYRGVELGALDDAQRAAAWRVVHTMLSRMGQVRVRQVTELESVLRERETAQGRDASHRDPGRYALLVAGDPAGDSFVVRFQGHHVSLRCAVFGGVLASCTPQFLGSNPHDLAKGRVKIDPLPDERVLAAEEERGRALLRALDDAQRARAVISADAPPDVLLGPGKPPSALGERRGLAWTELTEAQQALLWQLIRHYAHRLRGELAAAELERIEARGLDDVHFAWAGSTERGGPHYYRVHAGEWAIEYDCTQDDANHVHTVWRDFERDFGRDPLREHLRQHGRD